MRKSVVGLMLFLVAAPLLADKKLDDRMMHSASILQEIRGPLDEDAPGVLTGAYALAIFPEFVKVGLLGGVKHGRGVLATRHASGSWSKPAFVRITSGSFGLQFGVSMSQLLIVFKDPKAVEAISGGQFSIGADAGYAAGDLGGSAGAGTDNQFENKIVALARSKGLFAGVALEGGVLRIEKDSNVEFYNNAIGLDGRTLLQDTEVELPSVAQHFIIVVEESVPPLSPESAPVSWGQKGQDRLRDEARGKARDEARRMADSSSPDNARNGTASSSQSEPASTDWTIDPGQRPDQAIASAPGLATPGGASQGSWVTPNGEELPSGSGTQASNSVNTGYANNGNTGDPSLTGGTANEPSLATNWVSPEDEAAAPNGESQGNEGSGGFGLGKKIVGKITEAAWDGAKELALETIRSNPETQGAKVAAKVGGKIVDSALDGDESGKRAPKKPDLPPVSVASNNEEWVQPVQANADLAQTAVQTAAQTGQSAYPAQAGYRIAAQSPDSLPAIASTLDANFTGPPPPSEWPDEWRKDDILGGVCAPGT